MATIRQIVPSNAVSNFRPVNTQGAGSGFQLLAGAMDVAYDAMLPKAVAEMTEQGDALGREMAKQQIGDPQGAVVQSTMGGAPTDPNAQLGADTMAALGKGGDYRASLIGTESGGNWQAKNSEIGAGGKKGHFGRVQFGQARLQDAMNAGAIPQGTTPEAFMASPELQVAAENWHFADLEANLGDLVGSTVNGQVLDMGALVAMGHLGGAAGARKYVETGGAYNPSDSFGTSLSDYAATHGGKGGSVSASTSGAAYTAPTMLRGADGKLTARLFGPTSNPIMQAHDAAAGAAWQSEVFVAATTDFMSMSMSEQFMMDPDGFKQAADEYVTAMVEKSPDDFKMAVREGLGKEANRRFLGLVDEKHRNIRERASNSVGALAEKWADDLASAVASGNPEEIAAAQAELSSVLAMKERLPGSTWTPEQSANYMRKAEEAGQAAIKKAQDEQGSAWKAALNTVIDTAKAGRQAVDESILTNPTVQAMFPELWREAAAFTTLRDELPSFNRMTPAEQAQALVDMKDQPVSADWENDLYSAAEKAAAANATAWRQDPIKRAGEVLPENPPPPLPEMDPTNPEAFMAALSARADYGQSLMDQGYTDRAVYLSKEEAKTIGGLFGKDVPPEVKALAAGAVVGAMGPDAAGFFKQINTTDPILPHVGGLMAMGGDPGVATEAMVGQSLLDQKVVQAPASDAVAKGMAAVQPAVMAAPGALGAMEGIKKTAMALYAARIPAGADEQTQAQVMQEAFQAALGQSNSLGVTVGGVQKVGGQDVLLPPTVAGEDMQSALDAAFGSEGNSTGFWSRITSVGRAAGPVPARTDLWTAAGAGVPSLGGQPIDPGLWASGEIVMTPVGGSRYMLSVNRNGLMIDIGVEGQAEDVPFIFDAEKLIEASRVPK